MIEAQHQFDDVCLTLTRDTGSSQPTQVRRWNTKDHAQTTRAPHSPLQVPQAPPNQPGSHVAEYQGWSSPPDGYDAEGPTKTRKKDIQVHAPVERDNVQHQEALIQQLAQWVCQQAPRQGSTVVSPTALTFDSWAMPPPSTPPRTILHHGSPGLPSRRHSTAPRTRTSAVYSTSFESTQSRKGLSICTRPRDPWRIPSSRR
jgi:hypothetical protein